MGKKLIIFRCLNNHFKMATQMSVTQGLAELKLLDKRLNKGLEGDNWIAVSKKNSYVNEEGLKKSATAEYQSYMDLVKRRDSIKRAIVLSNAFTKVVIGTWSGTAAEAIEHKVSLTYKKNLLAKMKRDVQFAEETYKSSVDEITNRLDRLLSSELGKDVKTNPETIAALTASFQETNKVQLIDPLGLKTKARQLEDEIDAFESNVDWVLSEINGKTLITV